MKYAAAPWRCRHDNRLEWLPGRGLKTDTESCEEEDRIIEVRKRRRERRLFELTAFSSS